MLYRSHPNWTWHSLQLTYRLPIFSKTSKRDCLSQNVSISLMNGRRHLLWNTVCTKSATVQFISLKLKCLRPHPRGCPTSHKEILGHVSWLCCYLGWCWSSVVFDSTQSRSRYLGPIRQRTAGVERPIRWYSGFPRLVSRKYTFLSLSLWLSQNIAHNLCWPS